jgi:hypothetical protein
MLSGKLSTLEVVMSGLVKRVGVELIWLACLCAIGAAAWIAIASWYNGASDAYWTANGHPPPEGMFRAPWEWRFVILFTPYLASVAIRLLLTGVQRFRTATA